MNLPSSSSVPTLLTLPRAGAPLLSAVFLTGVRCVLSRPRFDIASCHEYHLLIRLQITRAHLSLPSRASRQA